VVETFECGKLRNVSVSKRLFFLAAAKSRVAVAATETEHP